ncbi:MAG: hypothetical protein ACI9IV_000402 [Paracoccaceae bacterium]|jgi:hypothetical protein
MKRKGGSPVPLSCPCGPFAGWAKQSGCARLRPRGARGRGQGEKRFDSRLVVALEKNAYARVSGAVGGSFKGHCV